MEDLQTAKKTEVSNSKQNNVYTDVPYTEQKKKSLKWVHSFKNINNIRTKAQLVARGNI